MGLGAPGPERPCRVRSRGVGLALTVAVASVSSPPERPQPGQVDGNGPEPGAREILQDRQPHSAPVGAVAQQYCRSARSGREVAGRDAIHVEPGSHCGHGDAPRRRRRVWKKCDTVRHLAIRRKSA